MKAIISITGKVIAKALVLFVLSLSSIFTATFKVFAAIYRFISLPIAVLGFFVVGYYCFTEEFQAYYLAYMGAFVGMVALRYLLPAISDMLSRFNESMKTFVFMPLFTSSPVRYTL